MKSKTYTVYSTTQLFAMGLQIGVGNMEVVAPSDEQVHDVENWVVDLWISLESESVPPEKIPFRKSQEMEYKGYSIKLLDAGVDQRGEFVEIKITQP